MMRKTEHKNATFQNYEVVKIMRYTQSKSCYKNHHDKSQNYEISHFGFSHNFTQFRLFVSILTSLLFNFIS